MSPDPAWVPTRAVMRRLHSHMFLSIPDRRITLSLEGKIDCHVIFVIAEYWCMGGQLGIAHITALSITES